MRNPSERRNSGTTHSRLALRTAPLAQEAKHHHSLVDLSTDASFATPKNAWSKFSEHAWSVLTARQQSLDGSGVTPLCYKGTPAQGWAALQATLASFPEAQGVRTDARMMAVVFTTPIGFIDYVDFRIDPQGRRIDYRSRSSFGLFDFGKNRSRMREFSARFEQHSVR